ncbi:endonuclease/exonuclease/phosphatase family protein, partial [Bacteroides cellulosilyticus]
MKKLLFLISLWLCVTTAGAQQNERDLYSVAFYNLENLFDTIHDAGKNDLEFLPSGS